MSSFEESKIGNILSNEKTERKLFSFNQTNLSRIYPKGTRFLSSNLGERVIINERLDNIFYQQNKFRSNSTLGSWLSNGGT